MTVEIVKFDDSGFPVIEDPPEVIKSLWDAVDPCAFLCFCVQTDRLPFDDTIKNTLDTFGWLNAEGWPDYNKMTREFQRFG